MTVFAQNKKPNAYLLILLFICSVLVYTPYNRLGLWVIMPCILFYEILKNRQLSKTDCYYYYILLFLSFCSCIIADYKTVAFNSLFTILTGFVGFFIFFSLSKNIKNISWLFAVYIAYNIGMWWYIVFVSGIANIDISLERAGVGGEQLNANDVAYMTFYFNAGLWMLYMLSRHIHKNKLLDILLFTSMSLLSFTSAILFASRQILVIELPFILGLFYINFFYAGERRNISKWVIPVIAIFMILLLYQRIGEEIFFDSLLFKRYESVEEDSRFFLIKKALEVGIKNPILGVGCGNFMLYSKISVFSHCSYTELFANSGIIAAFVYLVWIVRAFHIQFKRFRRTKNILFLYLALIIAMWFFSNFFYVYYTNVWLMGFWGLILGTSNTLYRKEISN